MKSRVKIIVAICLGAILIVSLFFFFGYDRTWKFWFIPTMSPHFADLRTITHGAESYANGYDPIVENPYDPWQRGIRYPRAWYALYHIGINQNHTTIMGIGLILLFLGGVCIILPNANNLTVTLVMAVLLSPATLFCIERGNTDLLMFFLVAISAFTINQHSKFSVFSVFLGYILKIYPIYGIGVFLRLERVIFVRYLITVLFLAILYGAIFISDFILISTNFSTNLSFGLNVLWMTAVDVNPSIGFIVRIFSYVLALILIIIAISSFYREESPETNIGNRIYFDSFVAGTSIFLGTFLFGISYDYKLIFLILTLPQLIFWSKSTNQLLSGISKLTIFSILVSMWYLLIAHYLRLQPNGIYFSFALKHTCNWILFAGLLYLFLWSMPTWIKLSTKNLLSRVSNFDWRAS